MNAIDDAVAADEACDRISMARCNVDDSIPGKRMDLP